MRRFIRSCWSVALLSLSLYAVPSEGQTIRGVVLDAENDAPIATAQVNLLNRNENRLQTVVTDGDGRFSFDLEHTGRYLLRASRIGFVEVTTEAFDVLAGEVLQVEVRISVRPIELPPLTVVAERPPRVLDPWMERGGYYERLSRYSAFGQFLGVEELDQIPARNVQQLFRVMPGLRTSYSGIGGREITITNRRGHPVCWYLNGQPLRGVDPADVVTPSMLVAVEIYSRGVIPGDFRCGGAVIGLWTGFRDP